MSEYQYYEFLAIDRPLTAEEMSALRRLSTRAHITPVSFTNEYHWGDFKGNPDELMKRYFDAHVYVANWMTAIFMVRVPTEAILKKTAEAMAMNRVLDFDATPTHWLITWRLEESVDDDRFGAEDGRGWMARLTPVRDELLRGDIRSLYIGWLAAVTRHMVEDDELEPLSVEGLGNLTTAQQALAEFLEVDDDLLVGVGIGSPVQHSEAPWQRQLDDWLGGLPRAEVVALLKQLLEGQGQKVERTLKNRFLAWQRGLQGDMAETPLRPMKELWKNAEAVKKIRLEREKQEQERLTTKRRLERDAYLKALANNFPEAWKAVQQKVERGSGLAYDEACRALVDLSEAYSAHASRSAFRQELSKFMAEHVRRKALVQRLVKAGIWKER